MIKLLDDIFGAIWNRTHDAALSLYAKAKEPTPGGPESHADFTARRKFADQAKFQMVLNKCSCPYCQEKVNHLDG